MHGDWVKGGGSAKGNFWLDSALGNRRIVSLAPVLLDFPKALFDFKKQKPVGF
jgi:hypothetical protein